MYLNGPRKDRGAGGPAAEKVLPEDAGLSAAAGGRLKHPVCTSGDGMPENYTWDHCPCGVLACAGLWRRPIRKRSAPASLLLLLPLLL
eukprot:623290-Heterocapsa_arctica.AAC.1